MFRSKKQGPAAMSAAAAIGLELNMTSCGARRSALRTAEVRVARRSRSAAPARSNQHGGAKSIAELTSGTMITRQAVTKHLQVLSKAGLVRGVKAGRTRLWEFEATRLDRARRSLDLIAEQWDQALNRLKTMLESGTGSEPVK